MNLIVETLTHHLHQQLTEFPFHNLNLLNATPAVIGGTCFDHALRLKRTLLASGFQARLHEAEVCMTGEMTHRLVKTVIDGESLFLDTGSGWPTCNVVAANGGKNYEVAGVKFKLLSHEKQILVQRYNGGQWLNMNRISVADQDETAILNKFKNRYEQKLPISDELRLCWLENQTFYRIAGTQFLTCEAEKPPAQCTLSPREILCRIESTVFRELVPDLRRYLENHL